MITLDQALELAKQKNCAYIETSGKTAENVVNAFEKITRCKLRTILFISR